MNPTVKLLHFEFGSTNKLMQLSSNFRVFSPVKWSATMIIYINNLFLWFAIYCTEFKNIYIYLLV